MDSAVNVTNNATLTIDAPGGTIVTGPVLLTAGSGVLLGQPNNEPPPVISGSSFVCATPSTFTLLNYPPNSIIIWTASPGLSISGNGSSAVVSRPFWTDSHFNGWVRATISIPGSPPRVVQRNIDTIWRTGIQNQSAISVTGSPTAFGGEFIVRNPLTFEGLPGSNFWWTTTAPWQADHQGAWFVWMSGDEAQHFPIYVTVSFTDVCGGNSVVYGEFWPHSPWHGNIATVYPKPTTDFVHITIAPQAIDRLKAQQQVASDLTFDIQLFDTRGNMLRQTTTKGDTVQLDVSNLPTDVYYLHISDGVSCTPEVQQVLVER